MTYPETRKELEWVIDVDCAQYGFDLWATHVKENNRIVGQCGMIPWVIDGRSEVEIAVMNAKEYGRRGLGWRVPPWQIGTPR